MSPAAKAAKRPAKSVASRAAANKAPADPGHPLSHDELYSRILRFLRRLPNRAVDLAPLAGELGIEPHLVQLELERLARRGFVVLPFIEPDTSGGAELTQKGLEWLVGREGGRPKDVPVALKPAKGRVRAENEAARLPRADVYGTGR